MDLEALRMFVKVAQLGSFTRAAAQLGLSKARASLQVRRLEEELGVRLLQRTTRSVRPTPDGEQLQARAERLLQEAEEVTALFQAPRALRGVVRLDVPTQFARTMLVPKLAEFLSAHPHLELVLSATDRRVDVMREGFDCVLRVGAVSDPALTAKRLGELPMANLASADYVRRRGVPRRLEDLDDHLLIHYSSTLAGDPPTFEYRDGDRWVERRMQSLITVNSSDASLASCLAGLGISQAPRMGKAALLADGTLVEVLPEHTARPMPVSIIHAHGRNVPKRVRAVMTWIAQTLEPHLR